MCISPTQPKEGSDALPSTFILSIPRDNTYKWAITGTDKWLKFDQASGDIIFKPLDDATEFEFRHVPKVNT